MLERHSCTLCPRECGALRNLSRGFCGAGQKTTVAKVMLHKWEEPGICFGEGSGAIFFSGCQLKCVFCQNHDISSQIKGRELERKGLTELFFKLESRGACNINLISPTPYITELIPALEEAKKKGLRIPVVFNSGGYEKKETIRMLSGLVDIYLPDFKFASSSLSSKYACAENYAEMCVPALEEMYAQVGQPVWERDRLKRGLMIRHLILPNARADSISVLEKIRELFSPDSIILSLLRQYTPHHLANHYPEISRPITNLEYQRVVRFAEKLGFPYLYTQGKESVGEEFIPDFSIFADEID